MPHAPLVKELALEPPLVSVGQVHHRLYLTSTGTPVVIVFDEHQDYDRYDARHFLSRETWGSADETLAELEQLLAPVRDLAPAELTAASNAVAVGIPVTRDQALRAYVARSLPAREDRTGIRDAHLLAKQLRQYAFEGVTHEATTELLRMADRLDGGTGTECHHGCPDTTIPTAECTECWMTLAAESDDTSVPVSIFAADD